MPKRKSPSKWIEAQAVRLLPNGSIQLRVAKGTMANPGKRKSFLKKVGKVFGKVVSTGRKAISNPSSWYTKGIKAALSDKYHDMYDAWQKQKGKPKKEGQGTFGTIVTGEYVEAQEMFYEGYNSV